MWTPRNPGPMLFAGLAHRDPVAAFGSGTITTDAGELLEGTNRAMARFVACFTDGQTAAQATHAVRMLVGRRVFGITFPMTNRNSGSPAVPTRFMIGLLLLKQTYISVGRNGLRMPIRPSAVIGNFP